MVHTRIKRADTLVSGSRYTDGFHLAVALSGPPGRTLFIGGGGAIGPRQFAAFYPGTEIDVVEIDPRIVGAARRFFGLAEGERLRTHVRDGRMFVVAASDGHFDVVVLDAYDGAGRMVEGLASREFFALVRRKLRPGGVLCVNLVGDPGPCGSPVRRAAGAIALAFSGQFRLFRVPGRRRAPGNCIAVAARGVPARRWDELISRSRALDRRVRFAVAIARQPVPLRSADPDDPASRDEGTVRP